MTNETFLITKSVRILKDGKMEKWKDGKMERWKDAKIENGKMGKIERWKDYSIAIKQ